VQHVFYASTPDAMLVYLAAFFVWGIGSGLIVLWQRRLMPIIVAHLFVNLFTSAPALVIAFLPPEAFAG
jgi:membrane protease YdiL (CAAX protease family)